MIGGRASRTAIAVALASMPAFAAAQDGHRLGADVSVTAGYQNNPFTISDDNASSAVVSLDFQPYYTIQSARNTLTLSGAASLQQYLRRYSRNDSYSAAVDYTTRPSEQVTAHGRIDLSSAVLGSNGLYYPGAFGLNPVVGGTPTTDGTVGPVLPTTPAALPGFTDVGLFGLRNRRRLARASGDVSVGLSALDSLTASAYAEAARYRRSLSLGNYETYSGSLGYDRRVSERFRVGVRATATLFDYRTARGDSRAFPIELTASGQLSALWTIDGSIGATIVDSDAVGSTRSTSLSGTLNLCRRGERSTMCAQLARQVAPTGLVGSQYVTTAGLNWSLQLDERESVSLGASYSNVGGGRDTRLVPIGDNTLRTEYVQATAGYNRQIAERISLVASVNYRQLLDGGNGRPKDYGGQIGLSYRLGDPR